MAAIHAVLGVLVTSLVPVYLCSSIQLGARFRYRFILRSSTTDDRFAMHVDQSSGVEARGRDAFNQDI